MKKRKVQITKNIKFELRKHLRNKVVCRKSNNFLTANRTKMENLDFLGDKHSSKNIPLPSKKEYMKQLIYAVRKFINALRWRVYFHKMKTESDKEKKKHENHPDVQDVLNGQNNFGFKSETMAPEIPELIPFEQSIFEMINKITFRRHNDKFQEYLKEELGKLQEDFAEKVIVTADKGTGLYMCDANWYRKMLRTEISKTYRGAEDSEVHKINEEAAEIAERLKLEKRMQAFPKKEAYVTTKDHKEDFTSNPTYRLINSAKPDIGRVSRFKIQNWMIRLKKKLNLNQWRSTQEVMDWFNGLKDKKKLKFIKFDIVSFYPSITKDLLNKTIAWARSVEPVHDGCTHKNMFCESCSEDLDIIYAARKSFVFNNGKAFVKKGLVNFDVTMGAWDGAEIAELVGLYLLHKMSLNVFERGMFGLYRDDGLAVTKNCDSSNESHLKTNLKNVFHAAGLKIKVEINLEKTDFLDLELNLRNGTHSEWRKPKDKPQYINIRSNHPPNIIKQIPTMVAKRLSKLSSNEEIFKNKRKKYEEALEDSGYNTPYFHKMFGKVDGYDGKNLVYIPDNEQKQKKKRQARTVTWFNPPYNLNTQTNVGRKFLNLVKKHFKKGGKIDATGFNLSKVLNIHTVKLSYSTTSNMARHIIKHNNKALNQGEKFEQQRCNCRKFPCPLDGNCGVGPLVYQADVIEQNRTMHYIGMTGRTFKERYTEHRGTLNNRNTAERTPTRLSKHVWSLKDKSIQHEIKWKLRAKTGIYFPGAKYCDTCITEKMLILEADRRTCLNLRTEILTKCKHKKKFTLHDTVLLPRKKRKK